MLLIFFIVLVDLIGFGIMIPILAYYVLQLGGTPADATLCMALYAFGMFLATPILGRISDYFGRKPVLAISMAGSVLGYLVLGFADSILLIGISRLVSGVMAGNLSAAQAYISDITTPQNRAKGMGLLGAAFGLGFVIGPTLGATLAGDSFAEANLFLPAMTSAALSAVALITLLIFLPESLDKQSRTELRRQPRVGRLALLKNVVGRPMVLNFLLGGMIYNIGAGFTESIFPIWVKDAGIADGPRDMALLLLFGGLVMAAIQGGGIAPLVRKWGELALFKGGALVFLLGMLCYLIFGQIGSYPGVMLAIAGQSAGAALLLTSMQSLISQCCRPTERGFVMGLYSSGGTLGRGIGTVVTGIFYYHLGINSPYISSAFLILLVFVIASVTARNWQTASTKSSAQTTDDSDNIAGVSPPEKSL